MPSPTPFVLKNGSKARAATSEVMPNPSSLTVILTYPPGESSGSRFMLSALRVTLSVWIVSLPPAGMASRAFTTRFIKT